MRSLETELDRARDLDTTELADAIEEIGFECTRCGGCCTAQAATETPPDDRTRSDAKRERSTAGTNERRNRESDADEPHTATVFPDEVRELTNETGRPWMDVARPMPYGLDEDGTGETFEWALQTDSCGDCVFYAEEDGQGACTVHSDRPLICETYPFSVALGGTSQPMGEAVDEEGMVRAHECEGLGRDISRAQAEDLADTLKERAVRELEEAIGVRDSYEPANRGSGETVVHDSEGAKRPDGTPYRE